MARTITKMDKDAAKALGAELVKYLEPWVKERGLTLQGGSSTYDPQAGTWKPRMTFHLEGAPTEAEVAWKSYHEIYGFKVEDLGKVIRYGRFPRVKITGLNTRSRKYQVEAVNLDTGRGVRLMAKAVLKALGRPAKEWM